MWLGWQSGGKRLKVSGAGVRGQTGAGAACINVSYMAWYVGVEVEFGGV